MWTRSVGCFVVDSIKSSEFYYDIYFCFKHTYFWFYCLSFGLRKMENNNHFMNISYLWKSSRACQLSSMHDGKDQSAHRAVCFVKNKFACHRTKKEQSFILAKQTIKKLFFLLLVAFFCHMYAFSTSRQSYKYCWVISCLIKIYSAKNALAIPLKIIWQRQFSIGRTKPFENRIFRFLFGVLFITQLTVLYSVLFLSQITMKAEDKASLQRVRIAVLGNVNVGKSGE